MTAEANLGRGGHSPLRAVLSMSTVSGSALAIVGESPGAEDAEQFRVGGGHWLPPLRSSSTAVSGIDVDVEAPN
jgi:hypothetical protein